MNEMKFIRLSLTCLAFLTVNAAAAFAQVSYRPTNDTIKSIGIVSTLGSSLTVSVWGLFNANGGKRIYAANNLGIDADIEKAISEKLASRFSVVGLIADPNIVPKREHSLFDSPLKPLPIDGIVQSLSASVDDYLVISQGPVPARGIDTSAVSDGLNIMRSGEPVASTHFDAFVFLEVTLVDAKTLKPVWRASYPPEVSIWKTAIIPSTPLDPVLWPQKTADFTEEELGAFKKSLVEASVPIIEEILAEKGLIPADPP